jgi:sec-independent protein translocase protein TatA
MGGLSGWHLLILLVVLVLLFGSSRLPDMARAVGQSARIFKGEIKGTAAKETTEEASKEQQHTSDTTQPPTG